MFLVFFGSQIIQAEKDGRGRQVWPSHFTNTDTDTHLGWVAGPTVAVPFLVLRGQEPRSSGSHFLPLLAQLQGHQKS